jgi:ribonuclease HI
VLRGVIQVRQPSVLLLRTKAVRYSLPFQNTSAGLQINGQYRVKTAALKPLYIEVKKLQEQFKDFSITHVPRNQNKEADRLTNMALDRV